MRSVTRKRLESGEPKKPRARIKRRRTGKPRAGRVLCPEQMEFVGSQPCCVTGIQPCGLFGDRVTVHHVKAGPGAQKDDTRTIPLVAYAHQLVWARPGIPTIEHGRKKFERFWNVDIEEEVCRYRQRFLAATEGVNAKSVLAQPRKDRSGS